MNKGRVFIAAALAACAASAQAQGIEVKLSGQVNRGVMFVDDGLRSEAFHVDNDNSSTRFRFQGTGEVSPGLKAGLIFEVEYQSSPSNVVTFADRDGASPTLDERYLDIFFDGRYGKLSMGQGDGAANGGVEVDLSGTSVAHYADISAIGGAFAFRTAAGGSGPTMGSVLSQQDFESRYDRLRYDTPLFGGARLALSTGAKDSRDVQEAALWYAADFARAGKLAAALGWSQEDPTLVGGIDDETVGGSVSWLAPGGFNLTYGHTQRDVAATREGKFNYFKAGYKTGKHAVSADYAMGDDQSAAGDEAKSMSLAYVYTPISWAELFALAKRAQLDQPGATYEDLTLVMVGTRLKF
jgi:porin-like protein